MSVNCHSGKFLYCPMKVVSFAVMKACECRVVISRIFHEVVPVQRGIWDVNEILATLQLLYCDEQYCSVRVVGLPSRACFTEMIPFDKSHSQKSRIMFVVLYRLQ